MVVEVASLLHLKRGYGIRKRLLVIVPHQDDEINIALSLIYSITKEKKHEVFVLYSTNGDYYPWWNEMRISESVKVLAALGVPKENIIYLGYGDRWLGPKHIYNHEADEVCTCHSLRKETVGSSECQDYRFRKDGHHSTFTKRNYINDLKDAIYDIKADIIVCTDFDRHDEHRALSLMFDEVMCSLIREKDYRPTVLKKFAYGSVFEGVDDYYEYPFKETVPTDRKLLNDDRFETDVPQYRWKDRIQLDVDDDLKKAPLRGSYLFKVAKLYRSQLMAPRLWYLVNNDAVYWWRNTDGLQYTAKIVASSGEASYLNDFKYIDCSDIYPPYGKIDIFDRCVWTPDRNDEKKEFTMTFDSPKSVGEIRLFENFDPESNILDMEILFDDGFSFHTGELVHDGSASVFNFDIRGNVYFITFRILDSTGPEPGLTEVEVYEKEQEFCYDDEILVKYDKYRTSGTKLPAWRVKFDRFLINAGYLVTLFVSPWNLLENIRERRFNNMILKKYDPNQRSTNQ